MKIKKQLHHILIWLLSFLHQRITHNVIRFLQQSIGFGLDTGIDNEVSIFAKLSKDKNLSNPIILDVGANVGKWSTLVSAQFPSSQIYAFEPSLETFLELEANLKDHKNVKVFNFGLGEQNSTEVLYYDEAKSGKASLSKRNLKHLNIMFDETESITIKRLDSFITELSVTPNLLKIDVEGHELSVLKGLGNYINKLEIIQFEFGGTDIDSRIFFRDFWNFFEDKPFNLFRLTPKGILPVVSYRETDEVFSFTTYFAIAI